MTKMNTLEMTAGNVFNLQDFEQKKLNPNREALRILLVHLLS